MARTTLSCIALVCVMLGLPGCDDTVYNSDLSASVEALLAANVAERTAEDLSEILVQIVESAQTGEIDSDVATLFRQASTRQIADFSYEISRLPKSIDALLYDDSRITSREINEAFELALMKAAEWADTGQTVNSRDVALGMLSFALALYRQAPESAFVRGSDQMDTTHYYGLAIFAWMAEAVRFLQRTDVTVEQNELLEEILRTIKLESDRLMGRVAQPPAD